MKKLSLFMAALFVITCFISCTPTENPPITDPTGDTDVTTDAPIVTDGPTVTDAPTTTDAPTVTDAPDTTDAPPATDSITTAPTIDPPAPSGQEYVVVKDSVSDYSIIYAARSTDAVTDAARSLKTAFRRQFGISMPMTMDSRQSPAQNEIIIGMTNRYDEKTVLADITQYDYKIFVDNGRIVIWGGCDKALTEAVNYFINNVMSKSADSFSVYENFSYEYRYDYLVDTMTIGGVSVDNFTLVYDDASRHSKNAAILFRDFMLENYGKALNIVADTEPAAKNEIRFGNTDRATNSLDKAKVGFSVVNDSTGVHLNITSGTPEIVWAATNLLINEYIKKEAQASGNVVIAADFESTYKSNFLSNKESVKIACIGDSITAGAESSNRETKSYPAQLGNLLPSNYTVVNYGLGGTMMMNGLPLDQYGARSYTLSEQYNQSLTSGADIVIIMLGTNDSAPGFTVSIPTDQQPKVFTDSAVQLIAKYRSLASKPDVVMMTSVQVFKKDSRRQQLEEIFMPLQKQIAKDNNCYFIDIFANTGDMEELYSDGLHLNDEGYLYLAELVMSGLVDQYGFTK